MPAATPTFNPAYPAMTVGPRQSPATASTIAVACTTSWRPPPVNARVLPEPGLRGWGGRASGGSVPRAGARGLGRSRPSAAVSPSGPDDRPAPGRGDRQGIPERRTYEEGGTSKAQQPARRSAVRLLRRPERFTSPRTSSLDRTQRPAAEQTAAEVVHELRRRTLLFVSRLDRCFAPFAVQGTVDDHAEVWPDSKPSVKITSDSPKKT